MRGRPILGAFCGLLLGAFVAIDLMTFKVRPLDTFSVIGLPIIGLVLGILLGITAPFRRGRAAVAYEPVPAAVGDPVVTDEP
jgi:hypothetical protein